MRPIKLVNTKDMDRLEWLKWRQKGIGGSEAAAIAGLNPWQTPFKVYMNKIEEVQEDDQDNERMRVGRDLEDYVAKRFEEATGKRVRRENFLLQHPKHQFMFANLDRMIVGEKAFLECKTTNSYAKSDWEEGIPLHYEIQCLHYMAVTGATHCYIAVLIGNGQFIWREIKRNEEVIQNLIQIEKAFWENHILTQTPPDPDGTDEYTEILRDKYKITIPESIELDEATFAEKLERHDVVKALIADLEKEKKQIEQEIQVSMQDHEIATLGDRKITWRLQNRNTVDTKRLKDELPDIHSKYLKTNTIRVFRI